jgi:hypothetical protein
VRFHRIVNLYEQVYGYLVNDTDKAFQFRRLSAEPVLNRHAMPVGIDRYVPNDWGYWANRVSFGTC